jgi:hypothetical protein
MTGGMAMFQSELRTAVRDARKAPMQQVGAGSAPRKIAGGAGRITPTSPRELGAPEGRTVVKLWLPLTPLWVLLAPFALLFAPVLALIPATRGAPPFRTALTFGVALIALSGTHIEVDTRDALVRIRIL